VSTAARWAVDGAIIAAVLAGAALWAHADPFTDTSHGLGFVALAVFAAMNLAAWHGRPASHAATGAVLPPSG
jgi:hypothetical protein